MLKNDLELTLNADTFSSMKGDFDTILNRTLGNMEMKGADEATITLKLSVKLEKTTTYTEHGALDVTQPSFKHDISSVMQVKDKKSGQLNGEMALVFDEASGTYILRPITNGQYSFGSDGTILDGEGNVVDAEFHDVEPKMIETQTAAIEMKEEEQEDIPEGAADNLFDWLILFVGDKLEVTESLGNYAIRKVDDGTLIMSTGVSKDSPLYIPKDKVEGLVGESLICAEYEIEDRVISVAIECESKGIVVAEADNPDKDEE